MATAKGILEIHAKGFGLLRNADDNFKPSSDDAYLSPGLISKLRLKTGLEIVAETEEQSDAKKLAPVSKIITINGESVDFYFKIKKLRDYVVIDPEEQLIFKQNNKDAIGSLIDGLTPIGKGQRALIVAPPKAGKTIILKHIANSVVKNHPEVTPIILLIDERPEEVTDFQRTVDCQVYHSNVDQPVENHVRMIELVLGRAMHLAEYGKDVVLFVDSLTRMGRAYNNYIEGTGKTLSGGLDSRAMEFPRRFFGSARNLEEWGSLGIVATILIETGSLMDQVIFQEFKGTGNMELVLSRELAERRIFPAIDLNQSGTRKEEKLLSPEALQKSYIARKAIHDMSLSESIQFVYAQFVNERTTV